MKAKSSLLLHSAVGATGTAGYITYTLDKSSPIALADLSIGHATINLPNDQTAADPDKFKNKKPKDYVGLLESDGIQVTLFADGPKGNKVELSVFFNGAALTSNPITIQANTNGRVDTNKKYR